MVHGELLELRQLGHAGPVLLAGRAEELEDPLQLVVHVGAGEERPAGGHLVENAADAPHVDGGGVLRGAEEDVRGPVPEGDHLVGVRLRRDGLGAGEAEVGKLEKGERVLYVVRENGTAFTLI